MVELTKLEKKLAELKSEREYWGNPLTGLGGIYGTAYTRALTEKIKVIEKEIDDLKRKEV